MPRRPFAARILAVCGALAAGAAPAAEASLAAVAAAVEARAAAHGFDGAILIGEPDGTSRILTIGKAPVDAGATWRWASITKQLTAVLVMQEVAHGRIDLDAPVARYWPDWRAPHAGTIRVRDLLRHRSGLPQPDESAPDRDGVPGFYRGAAAAPAASANGYCAGPPKAAPPARFDYNNCDSIVLGEVLHRVTGQPFEVLVRERFVRLLGLESVGVYALGGPPLRHVEPTGEAADVDRLIELGVNGPSGGAYGTIGDLWRFDRALLDGRLLDAAHRERMWEATRADGFHGFHQWVFPAPLRGCAAPVRVVERQGLIGGIEHRNYLLPESGRALILFSRHRPTGLGDPWEGNGFAFELLSTVACR